MSIAIINVYLSTSSAFPGSSSPPETPHTLALDSKQTYEDILPAAQALGDGLYRIQQLARVNGSLRGPDQIRKFIIDYGYVPEFAPIRAQLDRVTKIGEGVQIVLADGSSFNILPANPTQPAPRHSDPFAISSAVPAPGQAGDGLVDESTEKKPSETGSVESIRQEILQRAEGIVEGLSSDREDYQPVAHETLELLRAGNYRGALEAFVPLSGRYQKNLQIQLARVLMLLLIGEVGKAAGAIEVIQKTYPAHRRNPLLQQVAELKNRLRAAIRRPDALSGDGVGPAEPARFLALKTEGLVRPPTDQGSPTGDGVGELQGALILTRRRGEMVKIGDDIWVGVRDIGRGKVRLTIDAPRNLPIHDDMPREAQVTPRHSSGPDVKTLDSRKEHGPFLQDGIFKLSGLIKTLEVRQSLRIGETIKVTILEIDGNQTRIRFVAPKQVPIWRFELLQNKKQPSGDGVGLRPYGPLGPEGEREIKKIWVVDDSENLRLRIVETLVDLGYEVRSFERPADLVKALQSEEPDLVLTDLQMPGFSGLDLLQAMRLDEASRHIAVALMSFGFDERLAHYYQRAGFVDAIEKGGLTDEARVEKLITDARAWYVNQHGDGVEPMSGRARLRRFLAESHINEGIGDGLTHITIGPKSIVKRGVSGLLKRKVSVEGIVKPSEGKRKTSAEGRAILIDPKAVRIETVEFKEALDKDFNLDESPEGKNVETYLKDLAEVGRDKDVLVVSGALQSSFRDPNGFIIRNGQLIRKPDGVRGRHQEKYEPLNGLYTVFVLDEDRPGVEIVYIAKNALLKNTRVSREIQRAISGPVITWQGANVTEDLWIAHPPRRKNEVTWDPEKTRASFSAIGTFPNNQIALVHLYGNKDKAPELTVSEFADALLKLGVQDSILLEGSAGAQYWVHGDLEPRMAQPKEGSMTPGEGRKIGAMLVVRERSHSGDGMVADDTIQMLELETHREVDSDEELAGYILERARQEGLRPESKGEETAPHPEALRIAAVGPESARFIDAYFSQRKYKPAFLAAALGAIDVELASNLRSKGWRVIPLEYALEGGRISLEHLERALGVSLTHAISDSIYRPDGDPRSLSIIHIQNALQGARDILRGATEITEEVIRAAEQMLWWAA
ncbi:MAG: carbon storage regulator [Candidatus Omnitrophica bacterium]|nr:carbon storage regulator [Candidatus Omnitrophota bacterium]